MQVGDHCVNLFVGAVIPGVDPAFGRGWALPLLPCRESASRVQKLQPSERLYLHGTLTETHFFTLRRREQGLYWGLKRTKPHSCSEHALPMESVCAEVRVLHSRLQGIFLQQEARPSSHMRSCIDIFNFRIKTMVDEVRLGHKMWQLIWLTSFPLRQYN